MVRSRSRHLKASNEPRRVALVRCIVSLWSLAHLLHFILAPSSSSVVALRFGSLWRIILNGIHAVPLQHSQPIHGYPRQRSTTIMVRAPRRFFDTVVWRQFSDLHTDLWLYFEQTTERLIHNIDARNADRRYQFEPRRGK
jgi:hypothetical protein